VSSLTRLFQRWSRVNVSSGRSLERPYLTEFAIRAKFFRALIAGETVAKAAERCKVAYTTAFRWRHRFLSALNLDKPLRLSGIVEADEKSFKGKRPIKAAKRGLSVEQIPVIVARDRTGATIDAVLPRLDAASITAALGQVVTRPATPRPEAPDLHINNMKYQQSSI